MKIAFFVDDITKVGGIERVTSTLANQLVKKNGYEINIISIFKGREKPNYPFSSGIRIIFLSEDQHGAKPHSFERIKNLIMKIKRIRVFFKNNDFDLVIAQSFPPAFAMYLSGFPKQKIIVAEHVYAQYYGTIVQKIRAHIYLNFRKVVVLTQKDKIFFDKILRENQVTVIPNPVILKDSQTSALENRTIVSVGRLEYQKGYDNLIDCMKEINIKFPDWNLKIYGEGTLNDSLQRKIEQEGLSSAVSLCGHSDNINDKLREASFYVMSSHFEGFPMVLIEAMNQGLPCVSFDCPNGPSDIIKDGINGILVPNQDKVKLTKAIELLIKNKDKRKEMGVNAFNSVSRYSEKVVSEEWNTLFKELVYNE